MYDVLAAQYQRLICIMFYSIRFVLQDKHIKTKLQWEREGLRGKHAAEHDEGEKQQELEKHYNSTKQDYEKYVLMFVPVIRTISSLSGEVEAILKDSFKYEIAFNECLFILQKDNEEKQLDPNTPLNQMLRGSYNYHAFTIKIIPKVFKLKLLIKIKLPNKTFKWETESLSTSSICQIYQRCCSRLNLVNYVCELFMYKSFYRKYVQQGTQLQLEDPEERHMMKQIDMLTVLQKPLYKLNVTHTQPVKMIFQMAQVPSSQITHPDPRVHYTVIQKIKEYISSKDSELKLYVSQQEKQDDDEIDSEEQRTQMELEELNDSLREMNYFLTQYLDRINRL